MECREVRPALSELVDGIIARDLRPQVEAHLEGCAGCRSLLADLRRTREAARSLPKMAAPESLWPKVSAEFAAASGQPRRLSIATPAAGKDVETARDTGTGPVTGTGRRGAVLWFMPRRRAVVAGLAAAAVVVLGASAGVYLMSRHAAPSPSAAASATPAAGQGTQSVEAELELADQHYQKAIAALEQSAKDGQAVLDPKTAAVLQKNMGVVDQAIRESRAAIRSEPTSEVAQSTLFEALQRKVGLLRDTIALINEMRKGDAAGTARVAGTLGKT
jgi:anti-sigma factor RsiW